MGESAYIDTVVLNLKDPEFESQAESYLVELGPRAVPGVAAYLKGADKKFKIQLIDLLGNMHQPVAITYLEPYLRDQGSGNCESGNKRSRKVEKNPERQRVRVRRLVVAEQFLCNSENKTFELVILSLYEHAPPRKCSAKFHQTCRAFAKEHHPRWARHALNASTFRHNSGANALPLLV